MRQAVRKWVRQLGKTFAPRSPLWPEYSYAAFIFAFGISLLGPSDAFALSANYAVLSRIANESAWGQFFVGFGLIWFAVVASHDLNLRRIMAISGAFILAWLSLSIVLSNSVSTVGLPIASVALAAAYCAARLVVPWTIRP